MASVGVAVLGVETAEVSVMLWKTGRCGRRAGHIEEGLPYGMLWDHLPAEGQSMGLRAVGPQSRLWWSPSTFDRLQSKCPQLFE